MGVAKLAGSVAEPAATRPLARRTALHRWPRPRSVGGNDARAPTFGKAHTCVRRG